MRKILLLVLIKMPLLSSSQTQTLNQAATDAYIIVRMAEKFHVQPRAVDDRFSVDMFNRILEDLDEDRLYFTSADIDKLNVYRTQLDEEVRQKKINFLQLLLAIYQQRITESDTIIESICRQPFNFSFTEKLSAAEDTSYAITDEARRIKLYKYIKQEVLESMLEDEMDAEDSSKTLSKKALDALEKKYRNKTQNVYKRSIKMKMEYPGGVPQALAETYCSAVATCYDPHTEYLPLTEKENFEAEVGNGIFRFGFDLDDDEENDGVVITNLKPGSPAFKCGLLNKGDKILTLQWEGKEKIDVSDASRREVASILSASNHDKINIAVRKADGSVRELTLQKESLTPGDDDNRVKSFLLKGDKTIGYISLPAFYSDWQDNESNTHGCANDVATEILKLQKENIQGLILDLRYNGGGSLQEAIDLSGIFIDAGPVEQIKDKEGKIYTLKDINRGTIYNGPLLLLVNGYSASASEMVAGTLQDYNRALIAGTPTYGKATGQLIFPLDTTVNMQNAAGTKKTTAYVKITIEQLYRIKGTTAQKKGVEPDILIPDILELSGEREANEPLALPVNDIDANKYYRAYAAADITALKAEAAKDIAADTYFKTLTQYINAFHTLHQPKDISLKWDEALANYKKEEAMIPEPSKETEGWKQVFTVENNNYEKERMATDSSLQQFNNEIKEYLSEDHSLAVAYKIVSLMAK